MKFGSFVLVMAAALSPGYASAQDPDRNSWMAQVAKAAADGRCEEAKTIALSNGSLDIAERALKLCTPRMVAAPVVQAAEPLAQSTARGSDLETAQTPRPAKVIAPPRALQTTTDVNAPEVADLEPKSLLYGNKDPDLTTFGLQQTRAILNVDSNIEGADILVRY
jgi:hypothetical protein